MDAADVARKLVARGAVRERAEKLVAAAEKLVEVAATVEVAAAARRSPTK